MKNYILSLIIITLLSVGGAEAKTLTGVIYGIDAEGNQTVLHSAIVKVLETQNGTLSDKDGKFTLETNKHDHQLYVSYVGYKADTLCFMEVSHLEVNLCDIKTTDKVIVTERSAGSTLDQAGYVKSETITLTGLRKAACCNLSESFQTNASVDVEYSDAVSGAKQIQLLGLAGVYTQMNSENIPNMRGLAIPFGLNYIPGPWMQSISISKGAGSVTNGYESITGQINVDYVKPFEGSPLYVNLFANQEGRAEVDFIGNYEITDKLSTGLFLHGNYQNSEVDRNDDTFFDMPATEQFNIMNRWNYTGDNLRTTILFKAMSEERKGGQVGYFDNNADAPYGMKIKTDRYMVFGKGGYVFDTERYNSVAMKYSLSSHDQTSFFGNNNYDAKQTSAVWNLVYITEFNSDHVENKLSPLSDEKEYLLHLKHKLSGGLSFQYDDYKETFNDQNFDRIESVPGIFSEYTLSGLYDWTIVAGVRADFHNKFGTFFTPRVNIRYQLNPETVVRASVGKGFRTASPYAENIGLLTSSRDLIFDEEIKAEEAMNFGINATTNIDIFGTLFTIGAEYYRTQFINQLIVDTDRNPGEAHFYNLNGDSYSNSLQLDLNFKLFDYLDITSAYRLNDVKMTINDNLRDKPLISRHKAFINLAYNLEEYGWLFDITGDYHSSGRIPDTETNPEEYRLDKEFAPYILTHAQITKEFESFSLYLGVNNIGDYKQNNPILAYDKPFSKYFDSSIIWAPTAGRIFYVGFRTNIF
ncbi:MAG: TonB-dependent receptor [Candidatus Kapabacteria bacterium]|jgi:outer membrane receptor for ferrienterochelin and colicins|nr:TonB-dependent receptor [Candidatus Kapabacteria bacterium]